MEGQGTGSAISPRLAEHLSRAEAAVFWPVALKDRLGGSGRAGAALGLAVLAALIGWEHPGGLAGAFAAPDPGVLGRALFYALSLALILSFAALIPRAAQRDLDALAGVLALDGPGQARARAALVRSPSGAVVLQAGIGAALGIVHFWLSGGLGGTGFLIANVALWSLMVQTGALLVVNALLFAALGAEGVRVDPLAPDRLRSFVTTALRPMLLIMSLLAAYPLMLPVAESWGASTLIGPGATLLLALAAVWFPLRGLAGRLRTERDRALDRVAAEVSLAWPRLDQEPEAAARLEALLALRDRLRTAPILPLALPGLGKAALYLALPLATWTGRGVAEALLDRLLGAG